MRLNINSHALVAISSLFFATSALAVSDGTITFNGKITANTCTVKINNASTAETVTLPTASASALAATDSTAGRTQFTINLSDCANASETVTTYFEPGANVDSTTGHLTNSAAGGPTNVAIQLLNKNKNPIKAGAAADDQNDEDTNITGTDGAGIAELVYYAEYFAIDNNPKAAGDVSSQVTFSINYQ